MATVSTYALVLLLILDALVLYLWHRDRPPVAPKVHASGAAVGLGLLLLRRGRGDLRLRVLLLPAVLFLCRSVALRRGFSK